MHQQTNVTHKKRRDLQIENELKDDMITMNSDSVKSTNHGYNTFLQYLPPSINANNILLTAIALLLMVVILSCIICAYSVPFKPACFCCKKQFDSGLSLVTPRQMFVIPIFTPQAKSNVTKC